MKAPSKIAPQADGSTSSTRGPSQARGHRSVERIPDAASLLLEDSPPEELTTARIAAASRLSVGALYHFFPDKQAVLEALAVRHMGYFRASLVETVRELLRERQTGLKEEGPADLLAAIVDAYVLYLTAHPDFYAISFGPHISPATRRRQFSPDADAGITELLKRYMLEVLDAADSAELDLKLSLASQAVERLLALACEQPTREERDRILAAMKTMLAGYLFPA